VKPVAPAPLQGEAKKETAKVPASTPGSKALPQATLQLVKKDSSQSVAPAGVVVQPSGDSGPSELEPWIGIAAAVVALLSLGMQLWMMLG
jgi:hypothetical protein